MYMCFMEWSQLLVFLACLISVTIAEVSAFWNDPNYNFGLVVGCLQSVTIDVVSAFWNDPNYNFGLVLACLVSVALAEVNSLRNF